MWIVSSGNCGWRGGRAAGCTRSIDRSPRHSVLVDAFSAPFRSRAELRALVVAEHRIAVSAPVLYEWGRGPRLEIERADQEAALPSNRAVAFDAAVALTAARLYRSVARPRGREMDIMIAACAIEHGAALWTLNPPDFEDVPGLTLFRPSRP